MESIRPIQPELLAAKIEKIQNFEYPELLEQFGKEPELIRLLWFLEFVSHPANYTGGLSRFAADFIAAQSPRIGTAHMAKAKPKAGCYALADAIAILRELSEDTRCYLFGNDSYLIENEYIPRGCLKDWDIVDSRPDRNAKRISRHECNALLIERVTPERVLKLCETTAKESLAQYFKNVCELPHVGLRGTRREYRSNAPYLDGAPWYFVNVADALLEFIDERAAKIQSRIANTEVTDLVTRWIQKSRNTKQSIMITGNSRFGKSEAVRMNADMAPGSCRLVETPDSTAIGDLLREVARALGLEVGIKNQTRELRERIEYVLRYSGLQLIFDESQALLPGTFSRNTAPARLNWVRRSMMDRDIPVVFVCTPQSYLPAKKRFVAATGFAMEQFDERILKTVELPKELIDADLLAVAKIHFPNLRAEYLQFVVDQVISTERNFVSDIGKIALLAKDSAQEARRTSPTLADIESAMADVLPTVKSPNPADTEALTSRQKARKSPLCKPTAKPLSRPRSVAETLPIHSREMRPGELVSL